MNKKFLFLSLLLFLVFFLDSKELPAISPNGLWIPSWELNSPKKIRSIVEFAANNKFDRIFAEIRYRGDALYIPNKSDSTFPNPEPRSYFLEKESTDFDPLDLLIKLADEHHIKVFAWLTTFVITPKSTQRLPKSHLVFQHPEWITHSCKYGKMKRGDISSGLFLDPGIPEVREYTQNIILDILNNYLIHGIVLDYVRHPGNQYGYNPISKAKYLAKHATIDSANYNLWKQEELTKFVMETGQKIKDKNPNIIFATTGIGEYAKAKELFAQDWKKWSGFDSIDYIYLMLYADSSQDFIKQIESIPDDIEKNKIGISLRAWNNLSNYPIDKILSKSLICKKNNFSEISLFHYGGIRRKEFTIKNKSLNY